MNISKNNILNNTSRGTIPSENQINIPWSEDEWRLYEVFKDNLRRSVVPAVEKIHVRYENYIEWSNQRAI